MGLIDYFKVLKVYKDGLIGFYDKDALNEILVSFYSQFEHYATKEIFHSNPTLNKKVRAYIIHGPSNAKRQ